MFDFIIKICLFCSIPALIDLWAYRATGAPLDQSIWWWLRNLDEAPKPVLVFSMLTGLTFAGFAYGVGKDFYQSLISSPQAALFLGYRDHQGHYLVTESGQSRTIDINSAGPGAFRLDRVYQPVTIMYNPLSQLYWPLSETRSTGLFAFLAVLMLVFVFASFGHLHTLYLYRHLPDLLGEHAGHLGETELVPHFIKSLYSHAVSNPIPFLLLPATLVGGLALQSQRWKSESERLAKRQLPAAIKPDAVLTATPVETFDEVITLKTKRFDRTGSPTNHKTNYYAIFEVAGVYPHAVWVTSDLGSDLPTDKDDGVYPSLEDEFEKRTGYENAKPLADMLEKLKSSRPQIKVRLTQDLLLDWTIEPSLSLQEVERAAVSGER